MPIKYGLGNNQKDIHVSATALGKVKYGNTTVWQKSLPAITFAGNSLIRGLTTSDIYEQYYNGISTAENFFNGIRTESGNAGDSSIPFSWMIKFDKVREICEIEFVLDGSPDEYMKVYYSPHEYMFPDDNRWILQKTFTPAEVQVIASKYLSLPLGTCIYARWIRIEVS